ncbi:MAG: DUF86 domain-containing protein [Proteobacteria bacterium]|nr:DUF86 domain-containing protein [Pseudomonadota bacterium]
MPSREGGFARYLLDILENIDAAYEFVGSLSASEFSAERMRIYAATRALEIISEASRHIPDEAKARFLTINWRAIKAAGNVYRHAYSAVSSEVIWETIASDLPLLATAISEELRRLGYKPTF